MSMKERMEDALFEVITPQCKSCCNVKRRKWDRAETLKPTMTCSKIGNIPKNIRLNKISCEYFTEK